MSDQRFGMKLNGYQNGATSPSHNAILFQQQQRMQQNKMLKGGKYLKGGACNLSPATIPQFSTSGPQLTATSGGINSSISRLASANDTITMNNSNSSCVGSASGSCTGSCGGRRKSRFRLKRRKIRKSRKHKK